MANTDIPTNEPAVKAEPFRISGPGRYKDAGGKIAIVDRRDDASSVHPWIGTDSDGSDSSWRENGRWLISETHPLDIIAGPLPDEAEPLREMAFEEGYVLVGAGGPPRFSFDPEIAGYGKGPEQKVIDLSKVPASAIVQPKPEPKRVRAKLLLAVRKNGTIFTVDHRESITPWGDYFDAIVERDIEIEYTSGEGLGGEA